jgi:hypothetical protein
MHEEQNMATTTSGTKKLKELILYSKRNKLFECRNIYLYTREQIKYEWNNFFRVRGTTFQTKEKIIIHRGK